MSILPLQHVAASIAFALALANQPVSSRHILLLGIDLVSLDVPAGLTVLRKSELEHGEYDILRVRGIRVMRIVIDQGLDYSSVNYATTYYCINGIEGVTDSAKGVRRILLHLPPQDNEYRFYFEYPEQDTTAVAIMKTFRTKGHHRHCHS